MGKVTVDDIATGNLPPVKLPDDKKPEQPPDIPTDKGDLEKNIPFVDPGSISELDSELPDAGDLQKKLPDTEDLIGKF